jgi:hypothetical protein
VVDSILLYVSLFVAIVGVIALGPKRTRATAGPVIIAAVLIAAIVLLWPVRTKSVKTPATRLDVVMPVWQFDEIHTLTVDAPPERVFEAIRAVRAGEIRFFRTLVAIRRGGRPGPESILNAPENKPILDVATETTFDLVVSDPPHELVLHTVVIPPDRGLAAMNFLVEPDGRGGSIVSTQTRVNAIGNDAQRRFAIYWRIIHPGSDIIRRSWLKAVKRRAEAASRIPPPPTPPSPR